MTRKDSEKESDRPHYYSQFWLDIAAGRRVIGGPKPEDESELLDDVQEPVAQRHHVRTEPDEDLDGNNGHGGARSATRTRPVVTPVPTEEVEAPEISEIPEISALPEIEEAPVAEEVTKPVAQVETVEDADIPDVDFAEDEVDEEEESEDEDEEEDEETFEEEEDEENEGWVAGRGRKKPAPKRAVKQPPAKRPKREPRRGF